MLIRLIFCFSVLASCQLAWANPFEKPAWANEGSSRLQIQSREQTASQLQLKAILWSPSRPLANINGNIVEVGDNIAGFQVNQITEHDVQLESDGRLMNLSLQPRETTPDEP